MGVLFCFFPVSESCFFLNYLSFHNVKLIPKLNFLVLTDKFCYLLLCWWWPFVLFYCFRDWQQKPNFTACSEGEELVVFCSYIQKLSIKSLHRLLREWCFFPWFLQMPLHAVFDWHSLAGRMDESVTGRLIVLLVSAWHQVFDS